MKRSHNKICALIIVALSALAACIQQVSADVLIYDNFNRSGTLNGSTVDTGGVTWVSTGSGHNNTTTNDGGQEIGGWNARLAFTPQTGMVYKLTLNAGPTIQNALIWGFAYDTGGFGDYNYLSQDVADMAWARMGSVDGGLYDYGTDVSGSMTVVGTYTLDANTGPGYTNKLDLILNTINGFSSAQLTLKVNNVTKGTWTANVTGYNSIVFGRGTGTQDPNSTQISDLTLQAIELLTNATTLASSLNPSELGEEVIFTATIDPGSGTENPTGTIQFKVDGDNLGAPVAVTNGVGFTGSATSAGVSDLTAGDHTISAVYSGDSTYQPGTSSSFTQTVNASSKVATTTTLTSSPNPAIFEESVTFTATIDPDSGTENPTGTVQFKVDGVNFGAPVAVSNGSGLTGTAQTSTSSLSLGDYDITATYSGDDTYALSSSDTLALTVTMPANVLIFDNFNRNGTLNSSTVDFGSVTWTSTGSGHNNTTTNNSGQEIGGWNARLAFTPQTGKLYQLTLTAGPTIQNALIWGFAYDTGGFADYNFLIQDVFDMAWARMGSVDGGLYDYGTDVSGSITVAGTYTLDANTGPGYVNTLVLLLDTRSGLSSALMTLKVNNVTKGTWTANVTGYNSIVFGRGTGTQDPNSTQISDLTLEEVIPPPAGTVFKFK